MVKRRIKLSGICQICGKEEETVEHIFLYEWVRHVWFGSDIGCSYDIEGVNSFDIWISSILNVYKGDRNNLDKILVSIATICLNIWKKRCHAIFSRVQVDPSIVIARSKDLEVELYDVKGSDNRVKKSCESRKCLLEVPY